jgi:glyoxylase-like metal-dependent hydrolase (beta-lactamase superfamily II)
LGIDTSAVAALVEERIMGHGRQVGTVQGDRAVSIPFVTLDDPRYGEAVQVAPLVRRVIAKNPSKFTYHGTGTYIVGQGDVAVIDPGPHQRVAPRGAAAALEGERVRAILVTHCHSDHSPLAAWLREFSGAPTVAFGPHSRRRTPTGWRTTRPTSPTTRRSRCCDAAEAAGEARWRNPTRPRLRPRRARGRRRGRRLRRRLDLRAIHTPGHTSNHLCFWFEEQRALFTGDHIMGWSTTVIRPPDGDMRDYFASLQRVRDLQPAVLWPTHGAPVTDAQVFIDEFVQHRLDREAGVLAAVRAGTTMIPDMVKQLYVGVNEKLYKAAGRSVLAHLIKLVDDGLVVVDGAQPGVTTPYRPA